MNLDDRRFLEAVCNRVIELNKRYPGGHDALKNLSFTIDSGEMLFLAGHSGAGKSTLLKLISGIERATSGNVLVNDQNLSRLRPSQLTTCVCPYIVAVSIAL